MKSKKKTLLFDKKSTPVQGSGIYDKKEKALPLPVIKRCPNDTPTPAVYLSWRDISERMEILADEFKTQCLRYRKHPLKIDLAVSNKCADLADDCLRIKARVNKWPELTQAGVAGERPWVINRYTELIEELKKIKNS